MEFAILAFSILAATFGLIAALRKGSSQPLDTKELEASVKSGFSEQRQELNSRLDSLSGTIQKNVADGFKNIVDTERNSIRDISQNLDKQLNAVRETTEKKLSELNDSNQKKLDKIEATVSEKLDKTLAERVSESFKRVSDQLENVYKSLGEMQNLAADVGGLKKALTNVKVRGEMGEFQLGRILEQTLTADQYSENVRTKPGSKDPVEFAVKIPSKEGDGRFLWLPIDAKFPLDTYSALTNAYEICDKDQINDARKALTNRVKDDAKNICDKYIHAPETTDFAILFLPTEGLFAEIIRDVPLTEKLRSEYKVTVCGPSTITAFLNSLQMGFHTLTVEKRSGEIAKILRGVKTEFNNFAKTLAKVQNSINSTSKELDVLVGTRTRAIQKQLSDITALPEDPSSSATSYLSGREDEEAGTEA